MDFLTPFSYELGWVHGHASRAFFVGPWLCSCDVSIGSSHVVPFRDSHHLSNDYLVPFLELLFQRVSKRDSKTSFLNQILHLANPHDKLSAFVCIQVLGSQVFTDIGHLYLLSHVGWRFWDGEHELWWSWSWLGVIEIQVVLHILLRGLQFPVLYCDIFTYFVSFLIHSILRLLVVWNLFMSSLDHHSMFVDDGL
jgi:hypothetical protein